MAVFAALQQGALGLHRVAASPAACWISCAEPEVINQQLKLRACLALSDWVLTLAADSSPLSALQGSFTAAQRPPVHPTKPHLKPVQVLPGKCCLPALSCMGTVAQPLQLFMSLATPCPLKGS